MSSALLGRSRAGDFAASARPGLLVRLYRRNPSAVVAPFTFTAVLLGWEFYVKATGVSDLVLPAPSQIAVALYDGLRSGLLIEHFLVTFTELTVGFVGALVVALLMGTLISQSRLAEAALFPFVVALQTTPKIAIAPLILIWVGFGIESKILTAGISAFFPLIVSTIVGLRSVPPEKIDLLRAMGASRRKIFSIVQFPEALPFIFAGINIAIVMAVLGAIVGEFIGAKAGLGQLLLQMNYKMDIAGMFSILVVLIAMGLSLNFGVQWLRAKLIFWKKPSIIIR
jgi:NitT/TauT family transport system permease protein